MHKKKIIKKPKDINLPKEDIRVEKGQPTFLTALNKVIKKDSVKKKLSIENKLKATEIVRQHLIKKKLK
jgi:hypothetical protein